MTLFFVLFSAFNGMVSTRFTVWIATRLSHAHVEEFVAATIANVRLGNERSASIDDVDGGTFHGSTFAMTTHAIGGRASISTETLRWLFLEEDPHTTFAETNAHQRAMVILAVAARICMILLRA